MTLKTLEKKISKIKIDHKPNPVYVLLVEKFPPRTIKSTKEHKIYLELVGTLMRELSQSIDKRSEDGMRRYLTVLTPFIKRFEETHWPRTEVKGYEILAYLMEQNGLTQVDLEKEIGKQPYVSDILKGKKRLTTNQIQRLSKRFFVSPAVFFP